MEVLQEGDGYDGAAFVADLLGLEWVLRFESTLQRDLSESGPHYFRSQRSEQHETPTNWCPRLPDGHPPVRRLLGWSLKSFVI